MGKFAVATLVETKDKRVLLHHCIVRNTSNASEAKGEVLSDLIRKHEGCSIFKMTAIPCEGQDG